MNIFLAGWFGKGSVCDDMIGYSLEHAYQKHLPEAKFHIVSEHPLPPERPDLIVLGSGSHLGHVGIPVDIVLKAYPHVPFAILGAGFRDEPSLTPNTTPYLFKQAMVKTVRGYITLLQLEKMKVDTSDVAVVGDSCLLLDEYTKPRNHLCNRVAILPRNPVHSQLSAGTIKRIHSFLADVSDWLATEGYEVDLIPFVNKTDLRRHDPDDDLIASQMVFEQTQKQNIGIVETQGKPAIEVARMLRDYDLVISCRLHGFILSWIYGVPAIALEIEWFKVRDFCSSITWLEKLPLIMEPADLLLEEFLARYEHLIKKRTDAVNFVQAGMLTNKILLERVVEKSVEAATHG